MNLYIIFGAACSDANYLELLFQDPGAAARSLNLKLSDDELNQLNASIDAGRSNDAQHAIDEVRRRICPPSGVCPWVMPNPACQDARKSA
jgi:hypothetical protein